MPGAVLFHPQGLYLPRSGTAHRPFPTYFNGRTEMNNVGCSNSCLLPTACGIWPWSPGVPPIHEKSGFFLSVQSGFQVLAFSNKNVFNSIIILLTGRICYAIIMKSSQSRPFGR